MNSKFGDFTWGRRKG